MMNEDFSPWGDDFDDTEPNGEYAWLRTKVDTLVPMDLAIETGGHEEGDAGDDWADNSGADLSGEPVPDEDGFRLPDAGRGAVRTASKAEVTAILKGLGWRIRTTGEYRQAVGNFQAAYAIGAKLTVDRAVGPKTSAALRQADSRRKTGLPTASAHFSLKEFGCKCGGKYLACARIWIKRAQILDLEKYRRDLGAGVPIVSGCRCVGHNHDVGGVPKSRHMVGDATDMPDRRSPSWFRARGIGNGLGYNHSNNEVRHFDQGGVRTWIYV
jgi:hypothetical protein